MHKEHRLANCPNPIQEASYIEIVEATAQLYYTSFLALLTLISNIRISLYHSFCYIILTLNFIGSIYLSTICIII